jgi:hypothetical protein
MKVTFRVEWGAAVDLLGGNLRVALGTVSP